MKVGKKEEYEVATAIAVTEPTNSDCRLNELVEAFV